MSKRRSNKILRKLRELHGDNRPTTQRAVYESRRAARLAELDEDYYNLYKRIKGALRGLRNIVNKASMILDNRYSMIMSGDTESSDIVLFDYGTRLEITYKQSFVLDMDDAESITQQLMDTEGIVNEQMLRSKLFPNEYTTRTHDMVIQTDGELNCYEGGLVNVEGKSKVVKKAIYDDVYARIHNGEFVFRHTAVRGIGSGSVTRGANILYAIMDMYSQKNKHYPYYNDEDEEWQFENNPNETE